jgi:peroxiredoxin Q/BCP
MTDAVAEGSVAPAFTLPRDGGGEVSLAAFAGRRVALYFYPKDDTSGCTTEAIEFTGLAEAFAAAGCVVVGVSKDGVKKHDKFKEKHGLNVILASDEASDVCERYGVWVEKSMYGKKYMGIERSTFLIDADGRIARAWRGVKAPGHAQQVLEAARTLG